MPVLGELIFAAGLCRVADDAVLFSTGFGIGLRAVGENPAAVKTTGIFVDLAALSCGIFTGFLAGMAGA
ncbi:hypothetical protein [Mesorhizobium sp. M0228]|uniref:ABC transporter permease subunit n=1 Tax=Mesorhizobium sp. M0228 TaxID=2956923 RepID=UPI00333B4701